MFFKLWKYEIKSSYRSYALMYAILLIASLLISPNENFLNVILIFIFGVMIMVTLINTIVLIIRNYHQSMFQRTAYLTLTLPVSSRMIMAVKIINASVWFILSYIVIMLSILTLGLRMSGENVFAIFENINLLFKVMDMEMILLLVTVTVNLIASVALFYAILNFTHSCYVRKYRILLAIVIFVAYNMLTSYFFESVLGGIDLNMGTVIFLSGDSTLHPSMNMQTWMMVTLGINSLLVVVYHFVASYLLDKKLEIE